MTKENKKILPIVCQLPGKVSNSMQLEHKLCSVLLFFTDED